MNTYPYTYAKTTPLNNNQIIILLLLMQFSNAHALARTPSAAPRRTGRLSIISRSYRIATIFKLRGFLTALHSQLVCIFFIFDKQKKNQRIKLNMCDGRAHILSASKFLLEFCGVFLFVVLLNDNYERAGQ